MSRPTLARIAQSVASSSSSSAFASSSRCSYATKAAPSGGSSKAYTPPVDDSPKSAVLKNALYPLNSYAPRSSSPVGAHHHDHVARLATVLPGAEVHETIQRGYQLYLRHKRRDRNEQLKAKFHAMQEACEELDEITCAETDDEGNAIAKYPRTIYTAAIKRPDPHARPKPTGRKIAPGDAFREARIDGLMPREIWIPTETRGKGWNYDWRRPGTA